MQIYNKKANLQRDPLKIFLNDIHKKDNHFYISSSGTGRIVYLMYASYTALDAIVLKCFHFLLKRFFNFFIMK